MKFAQRSYEPELLDADNIPQEHLFQNLRELDTINTLLGGHAVTRHAFAQLKLDKNRRYRILDIGCGGGDTLRHLAAWGRRKGYRFELTGVDLKADCIEFATAHSKQFPEIGFVQSDYRALLQATAEFDIITCALFCHHFPEAALVQLFRDASAKARVAFIMNDLHRHAFAYYSISWLTQLFSKSYLVKNDARLSVKRAFRRKELLQMLPEKANATVQWRWAFRWLLIIKPDRHAG